MILAATVHRAVVTQRRGTGGGWEQPSVPAPAVILARDRGSGSPAWSRGPWHANPMLAQSQASPLLVTVGPC